MSRKNNGRVSDLGASAWKDKLHTVHFSHDEEAAVQDWYSHNDKEWGTCLEELLDSDFSVRLTPPSSGDDFWITATSKSKGELWSGHSYSVKYPDLETGIILCYYVIFNMLMEGQLEDTVPERPSEWLRK